MTYCIDLATVQLPGPSFELFQGNKTRRPGDCGLAPVEAYLHIFLSAVSLVGFRRSMLAPRAEKSDYTAEEGLVIISI